MKSFRCFLVSVCLFPITAADARPQCERDIGRMIRDLGGKLQFAEEIPGKATASVFLGGTTASDDDLKRVAQLSRLVQLVAPATNISDAGLVHLRRAKDLRELDLRRTRITDAGLRQLEGLNISSLKLDGTGVTDKGLLYVSRLKHLRVLSLKQTKVTDQGLLALERLTKLEWVSLHSTHITDEGLAHLEKLGQLKTLFLTYTRTTSKGLRYINRLKHLRELYLGGTRITDEGLSSLEGLSGLRLLVLANTDITDAGLAHLRNLDHLHTLFVSGTKITDAGLVHVTRLPGVQHLVLYHTGITDTGLARLKAMPELRELDVRRTKVSDAGAKALRRMLPEINIHTNTDEEEFSKLEGHWVGVAGRLRGVDTPPPPGVAVTFLHPGDYAGGEFIMTNAGKVTDKGTFEVNTFRTPREIQLIHSVGAQKGKRALGIYEFRNDELWLCMASTDDRVRPVDFSCPVGKNFSWFGKSSQKNSGSEKAVKGVLRKERGRSGRSSLCAVQRRWFSVGANPTRQLGHSSR